MGFLSAFTLIRTVSLFHITAAYFFITNPNKIGDHNVVFILGESMGLPPVTSLDKPSEASAFIAILLAFFGLSDLAAASLREETSLEYWLANVPVRLLFLFGVTGYAFLFREDGVFGAGPGRTFSVGENVQNSLVFTWGFFELAWWFWIFTSLREERRELNKRRLERLQAQNNTL